MNKIYGKTTTDTRHTYILKHTHTYMHKLYLHANPTSMCALIYFKDTSKIMSCCPLRKNMTQKLLQAFVF